MPKKPYPPNECLDPEIHQCDKKGSGLKTYFCRNKPGTFDCQGCFIGCNGCTDKGSDNCLECNEGYEKRVDEGNDEKFTCVKVEEEKVEQVDPDQENEEEAIVNPDMSKEDEKDEL